MPVTAQEIYEQTLVIRSQMGDESAFRDLLTCCGPRLLQFTQRMTQASPEQVADLMQEIWIAIYRGLPGLRDVSRFWPWAFRIARDRVYREYRRQRRVMLPLEEARLDEVSQSDDSRAGVDLEHLHRCLSTISPEHREVLVLRFFESLSYEDIARITGTSVGTVRSRIHYGKQALKSAWERNTP